MDYLLALLQIASTHSPELVGFILPPIVEILNKDIDDQRERFIVSCLVCFLVASLLDWKYIAAGTPEALIGTFTIIFAESQLVFKTYFANSTIRYKISGRLDEPNSYQHEKVLAVEEKVEEASEALQVDPSRQ